MDVALRAIALEELALHSFPGISFERLCADLEEEHQFHLDPFVKVSCTPNGICPRIIKPLRNPRRLLLKDRGWVAPANCAACAFWT